MITEKPCFFVRVFIAAKKHQDLSNSYKGTHFNKGAHF